MFAFVFQVVALVMFIALSVKPSRSSHIPRIGPPTPLGYIWTALRYTFNSEVVIAEGRAKYQGMPYIVPTLGGSIVVLGADSINFLQKQFEDVFSQAHAVRENLTTDQTMNTVQMTPHPYQRDVVRTNFTRAIVSMIPEILNELEASLKDTLRMADSVDSLTLPVFDTFTTLIGRVGNRAMVGRELCRNPDYVQSMVHFAETVVMYSLPLKYTPEPLRPALYWFLSALGGGKKEPLSYIVPFLKKTIADPGRKLKEDYEITLIDMLIDSAPPEELEDLNLLAMRVMNMNFGYNLFHWAFVSSTNLILREAPFIHPLFEIGVLDDDLREELRADILQALEAEGGDFTKESLAKMRKLDSLLREVGRVHGLSPLGLSRTAIKDGTLPNGVFIPAGSRCFVDLNVVHRDAEVYPNPETFDVFRFSRLREKEGSDLKWGFTTVGPTYLPFSMGRHACPGRFFASMELKLILSHLLLNYHITFPPGVTERPKNVNFDAAIMPDPKAKMLFKKRADGPFFKV